MFNLPLNSKICGNTVFHEGNHNSRENPHNQYSHKWDIVNTINNGTTTGQFTKLLDVTYEVDNNRNDHYWLTMFNMKNQQTYDLKMSLGETRTVSYPHNGEFEIWYTEEQLADSSSGKKNWKVTVYMKLWKTYNPIFVTLNMAKNNEVWNYTNDYAFNNIKLYSNQPLVADISYGIKGSNNANPAQRLFWHRQSWGEVTIGPLGKYQLVITDENIKWDSVVSFTYSVEIPSELMYTVSLRSGGGAVIINVRNLTEMEIKWPAGQIIMSIQQSF